MISKRKVKVIIDSRATGPVNPTELAALVSTRVVQRSLQRWRCVYIWGAGEGRGSGRCSAKLSNARSASRAVRHWPISDHRMIQGGGGNEAKSNDGAEM